MGSMTTRAATTAPAPGPVVRGAALVRRGVAVVALGAAVMLVALDAFDDAHGSAGAVERCVPRCTDLLTVGDDPRPDR